MIERFGKRIDSQILKKDLNKEESIQAAKIFSLGIPKGHFLKECPICSSTGHQPITTIYGFLYHECTDCGVLFVSNPPNEDVIRAIYRSDYYSQANKKLYANESIIDYRINNIARPKVEWLFNNLKTTKNTWLDIGCGVGEVLSVVSERGWTTTGIETNDLEREYATEKFGLQVIGDYITQDNLLPYLRQFGVVSMFGVLEHMTDPHSILKTISLIQVPDDFLIIEVPHYPSLSAFSQISFPDQVNRIMHPPFHLFLFSIKSLDLLLRKYDYEISHAWYFGQDFYEFFTTLSLFSRGIQGSRLHSAISRLADDFQEVIDSRKLSDEVLIIARRRNSGIV